jgi:hypothetical protein
MQPAVSPKATGIALADIETRHRMALTSGNETFGEKSFRKNNPEIISPNYVVAAICEQANPRGFSNKPSVRDCH